jgi:hypothetical protein
MRWVVETDFARKLGLVSAFRPCVTKRSFDGTATRPCVRTTCSLARMAARIGLIPCYCPTTPTRAGRLADASVDPTEARNDILGCFGRYGRSVQGRGRILAPDLDGAASNPSRLRSGTATSEGPPFQVDQFLGSRPPVTERFPECLIFLLESSFGDHRSYRLGSSPSLGVAADSSCRRYPLRLRMPR